MGDVADGQDDNVFFWCVCVCIVCHRRNSVGRCSIVDVEQEDKKEDKEADEEVEDKKEVCQKEEKYEQ